RRELAHVRAGAVGPLDAHGAGDDAVPVLIMRRTLVFLIATLLLTAELSPRAQQPPAPQEPLKPTFRVGTEIVLVNVVVRDKNGNVVRGLTRDDFSVTEDDKPQTINSFDFEELDNPDAKPAPTLNEQVLPRKPKSQSAADENAAKALVGAAK